MLKKINKAINEYNLIEKGEKIIVGVSGGIDSMVLLFALHKLGYDVIAAHFNHSLRGAESDGDEAFVLDFAQRYGIPVFSETMDIGRLSRGENLQNVARNYRYSWLEKLRIEQGATKIAVAHHRMDQCETVLLHLLRGAGLDGIAGMKVENKRIIRPMLFISRAEIEDFADFNGIPHREDSSNKKTYYSRNNLRINTFSELEKYNENLEETLSNMAIALGDDREYFAMQVDAIYATLDLTSGLELAKIIDLPNSLKTRIVRKYIEEITSEVADFRHTAEVMGLQSGKQISLAGGYYLKNFGGVLKIKKAEWKTLSLSERYCLNQLDFGINELMPLDYSLEVSYADEFSVSDRNSIILSEKKLGFLSIGTRKAGDYIKLDGLNKVEGKAGRKKIKDLFIDEKIPQETRDAIPLLYLRGEVVLIPDIKKIKDDNIISEKLILLKFVKKMIEK